MGFSKKTGKGRLDKYYYLAKEHGYRARSAFKLKQLDQKYDFLRKSRVLVDLCAAPGGWLQVASESMPMSHVIIGVDLVPIKPIGGVTTIVGDITTEKCRTEIRKGLVDWKADVVLHDGAPNVGNAWIQDAFSQAELTLHAFKLATELLNEGGIFLTKIFRSKEYPQVLSAFKRYFKKVDATKPESSRMVSAEIFVFCNGFLPSNVMETPIDIQSILSGSSETRTIPRVNILFPERNKVNREGYDDDATILFKSASLTDFLNSKEPDRMLATFNAITITSQDEIALIMSLDDGEEIRVLCTDLKVLGRREYKRLLKVHSLFNSKTTTTATATLLLPGNDSNGGDKVVNEADSNDVDDVVLFNELKSQMRHAKKREKRLARTRSASQNHMDLSHCQELEDIDDVSGNSVSGWFSNPSFSEVLGSLATSRSAPLVGSSGATKSSDNASPPIIPDKSCESMLCHNPSATENNTAIAPIDSDDLINLSFNRYAFNEDKASLPPWFVDDETQHNVPQEPITKEVADLLKEHDRLLKNRLPKKVLEAKNRMKLKSLRRMQTLKKKASIIAESEDLGEGQKIAQIQRLLSKAKVRRPRPKLVIAKGKLIGTKGRPRGVKGKYKMVDRRMLKDQRNSKGRNSK